MFRWLGKRTTGEIMVLIVAFTVCGYVIVTATVLLAVVFFTDRDVSKAATQIGDIINTLIGLLAGFLAGKTDLNANKKEVDQEEPQ